MEQEDKIVLPPKYYLDYFNYLLSFVQEKYKHVLAQNEWAFLRKYYALSEDEQCLFIRLCNRKGRYFEKQKINYEEIENIFDAFESLQIKGFIEDPKPEILQEKEQLIASFNKGQLMPFISNEYPKSIKKDELVKVILEQKEFWQNLYSSQAIKGIIQVNFQVEVSFIKFLFFGNRYMDMTEFVVRDLGFQQYMTHDDSKLVAQFEDRKDAEDKWMVTDQADLFYKFKKEKTPEEIFTWFSTFLDATDQLSKTAKPALERLILKVGQFLEREKAYDLAVQIFKNTLILPSRERQVRCLYKLNATEEALALCIEMEENASLPEEYLFAKDFKERIINKTKKNKKLTTTKLHEADSITIPSEFRGNVELGTINYYLENGRNAVFSENHLWRSIFGLVFWDLIYDPELVAFHHPFQRRPSDLHLPDFYQKRKDKIIDRLASFTDLTQLLIFMGECYEENINKPNPFIFWLEDSWELARIICEKVPFEALKEILHHISKDISEHSRGFPDLFVWDDDSYEFVEVKSPTDNLSNRQLYWLEYFEKNNVNAKVLRVYFD